VAPLTAAERACLYRCCGVLRERLGDGLVSVRMFGSAARGRQLSPHFFSEARMAASENERTRGFLNRIRSDLVAVWPHDDE